MTPDGVRELERHGVEVFVETGAGDGASIADGDYLAAGATIVPTAADAWSQSMVVKVKEPTAEEFVHLRADLTLFTYLHLAAYPEVAKALLGAGTTAMAYETVQLDTGALPLLAPMSEVAGRLAPQIGAHYLERHNGGRGVLMGGAPGVRPAKVVVLGAGNVGWNAAWIAAGMEAEVVLLDKNLDRLRWVDQIHRGRIMTLASNQGAVERSVADADLVIGAVLVAGGRAPVVVSERMVARDEAGGGDRRRRRRSGRVHRDDPRDDAQRPGVRGPWCHPLRRRQHARCGPAHVDVRADQRDPAIPVGGCGPRRGGSVAARTGPDPRRQHRRRPGDQWARRRIPRPPGRRPRPRPRRLGCAGGRSIVMSVRADQLALPEIDFASADEAGPDRLARFRTAAEQHWLAKGAFGYVLTHYDDVVAVLRDKRWHSAASLVPQLNGIDDPAFLARSRESILSAEGETHTRLRRLVGQAFSPRAADRLRPFMREVIGRLVDPMARRGSGDLVGEVCEPYPIPIICELLGAPKDDWQLFSRWAADVLRIFDANLAEQLPVIVAAQDELDAYTRDLIAERRSKPADDLLTALIAAEESGDKLTNDELVMMVIAVIVGGTDTTRNQLGCAVALFAEHPEQWALLGERPELAPQAVEESMRYLGAVRGTGRIAAEDIDYRGVVFPAGSFIAPAMAIANRDESVWIDPDRFDISRPPSGQPQLTFGSGIHYCLGASLARAELQEALPILARRLPGLAIDGLVRWKPATVAVWGPEHLPLRFDPTS